MSYRTWMNVKVVDYGDMTPNEVGDAFTDVCDEMDLNLEERNIYPKENEFTTAGEDNNTQSFDSLVDVSKKYPKITFEGDIDGTSEESDNQSVFRVRNGVCERIFMEKNYKPFAKVLTEQETYVARRWPHRDREVGDILAALRTLSKNRATPALRKANPNRTTNKRLLGIAIAALEAVMEAAEEPVD